MSEDLIYKLISGEIVINDNGTFFFASPGDHIRTDGFPIYEKLHREDGPAVIYPDGNQIWYQNGKLHREDGPAVVYFSGSQEWYLNGKQHRNDGPAATWSNGAQEWYLNGESLTEEEFNKRIKK